MRGSHGLGYSLQANRKTQEGGGTHPDRDGQFEHLNTQAAAFLAAGEPAVSVDAKKKELVGEFKNPGLGRATSYRVYEPFRKAGWVNVGIDHDTAAFAVESIRRWWNEVGWYWPRKMYSSNLADLACWRLSKRTRSVHSLVRVAKNDSITALS